MSQPRFELYITYTKACDICSAKSCIKQGGSITVPIRMWTSSPFSWMS